MRSETQEGLFQGLATIFNSGFDHYQARSIYGQRAPVGPLQIAEFHPKATAKSPPVEALQPTDSQKETQANGERYQRTLHQGPTEPPGGGVRSSEVPSSRIRRRGVKWKEIRNTLRQAPIPSGNAV
ncbi:unnamed protein product [Caretta caretta]